MLFRSKLKAIAIGGNRRSPLMPEVPTFAELGYPEVETHAWFGLFLPAAAPRELASRLQRDISRFMSEPEFRERQIIAKGYDAVLSTPEEMQFESQAHVLEQLRPGLDGLILADGGRRGTFLPQVWDQLPTPSEFLTRLKAKAGLPLDHWSPSVRIWRYTTETFGETAPPVAQ